MFPKSTFLSSYFVCFGFFWSALLILFFACTIKLFAWSPFASFSLVLFWFYVLFFFVVVANYTNYAGQNWLPFERCWLLFDENSIMKGVSDHLWCFIKLELTHQLVSGACVCSRGCFHQYCRHWAHFNGAILSFESRTDDTAMFPERCLCVCVSGCEKRIECESCCFGARSNSVWCDFPVAEGVAPGAPSKVYASETDRTYIVLSWTPPEYHDKAPMWYYIEKVGTPQCLKLSSSISLYSYL